MDINKLENDLNNLEDVYQKLCDEYLPKDGDLNKLDRDKKIQLLNMKEELVLLRKKISQIKGHQPESEEYLKYLEDLKNKFTDEIPPR